VFGETLKEIYSGSEMTARFSAVLSGDEARKISSDHWISFFHVLARGPELRYFPRV
jgi:hypothetical protein